MYGWIWARLPGSTPVRALLSLLLFLVAVAVLFTWVFPWAEPLLPFNNVTVNNTGGSTVQQVGTPGSSGPPAATPSARPSPSRPATGGKSSAPTIDGAALPTSVPLAPTGVTA
ncbi:hypothetical protein GXW82_33275 [Streptacidiphilus sp. 4-A2]|nr:hypothetical protein [Streptacidiphilus sp. 4-A2]